MERLLTVEFGPSRSKRFPKAVAEARGGAGECAELERGRYQVRFVLRRDAAVYTSLARLLQRVRAWRATDVYERDQLVSSYHAREMAWCASFQLTSFGDCRERFDYGVLPRCAVCPLFDAERAIRAGLQDDPAPEQRLQVAFGSDPAELGPEPNFQMISGPDSLMLLDLLMLLDGEIPSWLDLSGLVPDFPPEEWGESADDEPAG